MGFAFGPTYAGIPVTWEWDSINFQPGKVCQGAFSVSDASNADLSDTRTQRNSGEF